MHLVCTSTLILSHGFFYFLTGKWTPCEYYLSTKSMYPHTFVKKIFIWILQGDVELLKQQYIYKVFSYLKLNTFSIYQHQKW